MEKELMFREADVVRFLGRVDYSVGTLLERCLELRSISSRSYARMSDYTRGMISVGCVVSLCASSSL